MVQGGMEGSKKDRVDLIVHIEGGGKGSASPHAWSYPYHHSRAIVHRLVSTLSTRSDVTRPVPAS